MALTPEQLRYLGHLRDIGYLPPLEQFAKRLTAPIWWHAPAGAREPLRGGTVCFVHTGARIVGITAEHVHREIAALKRRDSRTWCQVGGHTFDPPARLIDADRELDIATYDFSEISANAAGADVHHPPSWPPATVDGAVGIVGGWPWQLGSSHESRVSHHFLHFVCQLQATNSDQIGAATFTATSVPWGAAALPAGTNLGGMSGGPVFRLISAPIEHLLLVGIVYEYQPTFELVLARPLSCIRADGTIDRRARDV